MAKFTISFLVSFSRDTAKSKNLQGKTLSSKSSKNSVSSKSRKTARHSKASDKSSKSVSKAETKLKSTSSKRKTTDGESVSKVSRRSKIKLHRSSRTVSVTSSVNSLRKLSRPSQSKIRKPWTEIYIHQPLGFLHVDYEILSGKFKYSVDFIHFGPIVRMYTSDGSKVQCVYRTNKHDYCLFTISHLIVFTNEEVITLHKNICTFNVFDNRPRCNPASYRNVPKVWYMINQDGSNTIEHFAEVYSTNPFLSSMRLNQSKEVVLENNVEGLRTKIEKELEPVHKVRALFYIQCISSGKRPPPNFPTLPQNFDLALNAYQEMDMKSGTAKKSKKSKQKDGPISSILIPGEMLFTDPRLIDYRPSDTFNNLNVYISVQQMLTGIQQAIFNPIVISIDSIHDLPHQYLKSLGFTEVYLQYSCKLFGDIRTRLKSIPDDGEKITFHESRAFLMHTIDNIEYIKFIQTNRLRVEVRGIKTHYQVVQRKPTLYGLEYFDEFLMKTVSVKTRAVYQNSYCGTRLQDELLCVAILATNMLLRHQWSYFSIQSCVGSSIPYQNHLNITYPTKMKLAELSLIDVDDSVLKQAQLFELNTNLTMNISFSYPLQPYIVNVLTTKRPFNRLFLIFYDETLATNIYNEVIAYNSKILKYTPTIDLADPNIVYMAHDIDRVKYEEKFAQYRNVMTGFLLDNMRTFYVFLEGPAVGYIQHIWHSVMLMETKLVRVIYDTDLIFNTRIYSNLLNYNGIYNVTLSEPLELLLKMTFTFVKSYMPIQCFRCIRKLDLLLKARFMTEICQARLCPTIQELMSLNDEFGVWLTCSKVIPAGVLPVVDDTSSVDMNLSRRGTYLPAEFQQA